MLRPQKAGVISSNSLSCRPVVKSNKVFFTAERNKIRPVCLAMALILLDLPAAIRALDQRASVYGWRSHSFSFHLRSRWSRYLITPTTTRRYTLPAGRCRCVCTVLLGGCSWVLTRATWYLWERLAPASTIDCRYNCWLVFCRFGSIRPQPQPAHFQSLRIWRILTCVFDFAALLYRYATSSCIRMQVIHRHFSALGAANTPEWDSSSEFASLSTSLKHLLAFISGAFRSRLGTKSLFVTWRYMTVPSLSSYALSTRSYVHRLEPAGRIWNQN